MGSISHSTISRRTAVQSSGRPLSGTKPYVVVIFGRTGVGISSLVNLITGHPVSNVHPDARASVKRLTPHSPVSFPGSSKQFSLYELPGFHGRFSSASIIEAIRRIDQGEGIDLVIYCLRKQKSTVMPEVVRNIRDRVVGHEIPMIAVVTELERFEAEGGMEDWWVASCEDDGKNANGTRVEQMCFGGYDTFDAHACITTLPRREVDLVQTLRKRRDKSEERIRRLILEQCREQKREARESVPGESHSSSSWFCRPLSALRPFFF